MAVARPEGSIVMSTERQREQRRASGAAKHAALVRLRDNHPEEYRALYNEECEARGVRPLGARRDLKRQALLRQLAELDARTSSRNGV